jgi:hypothetical protein
MIEKIDDYGCGFSLQGVRFNLEAVLKRKSGPPRMTVAMREVRVAELTRP